MKSVMNKLVRDEKGAALIVALILLLVGGLLAASLLGYMGSGLLVGKVYDTRTAELYAADAGVEDAMWKIQHPLEAGLPGCGTNWTHTYPEAGEPPFVVNGKSVVVTIHHLGAGDYTITSIATTDDGGGTAAITGTEIESYVSALYMDFSSLLDNAIISYDTITIRPGNEIDGDVWLPDKDDPEKFINQGDILGEVKDIDDMELTWPTVEQLSGYYLALVEGAPDPGDSIDVKYTDTIGPCYREGSLIVDNTGEPDTLLLEGTVYIAGDLDFQQSGASHNYTVDLNGHTIFAEGSIVFPSNVVGISGPGCIIAVGDIDFQPSIAGDDFVLVMSIAGTVNFQPSGDFTGCIAGNTHVELKPGCTINWISPEGKGLDFPMGADGSEEYPSIVGTSIDTWEINQQ